jgi:hypothetical protein
VADALVDDQGIHQRMNPTPTFDGYLLILGYDFALAWVVVLVYGRDHVA